uniref:RHS repeat-associated core domain-containing protein n=1 Tax=Mariniphaga sediminis TaxID=1628158 RepID=UPI00356495E1
PMLGRFLSPDNYVQAPDYTQNFNRYSYVLNNPLKYTDPSGEFAIVDSWLIGFIHGFFSANHDRFGTGLAEGDKRAHFDVKITAGLFATDPNKTFGGQVWEIISRVTWQAPQTTGGWFTTQWTNTIEGNVNWVKYKYGSTVVQSKGRWGGITQGSYIMGDESIEADVNNWLFQHEYGHYIQSQSSGFFFYSKYGIPSALSKEPHNSHPAEQDANIRAFKYFSKHVDGFNWVDKWGHQKSSWDRWQNPIKDYNWSLSYDDNTNQNVLNNGTLRLSWYDYFLGPDIVTPSLINWLILNQQY